MWPPTSRIAPASAIPIPATNVRVILSRRKQQAPIVTKSGAKFESNVELATEVNCNDQCHSARSPVKNNPAIVSHRKSFVVDGRFSGPRGCVDIQIHKNGSANSNRKNAV